MIPVFHTLKLNICKVLKDYSLNEEKALQYTVTRDRNRSWLEAEQKQPLVNVFIASITPKTFGSAQRHEYIATVNIDLIVFSKTKNKKDLQTGGDVYQMADESTSDRLDLLVAQVLSAITQLARFDFGFLEGEISRDKTAPEITFYSQTQEFTGNFAPARLSFEVGFPFEPRDNSPSFICEEYFIKLKENLNQEIEILVNGVTNEL